MRRLAASILGAVLVVALTLGAVTALVGVTIRISTVPNPFLRTLALAGDLLIGILWLLGTVYLATRMAVVIFGPPRPPGP
jgi:hypothetical protein